MRIFAAFRNKIILGLTIFCCIIFVSVLVIEKTRAIFRLIPKFRGEVNLQNDNFVITTTKDGSPIIINKDDHHMGDLRICGDVHSLFSNILDLFLSRNSVVIEIGPRFGYNTITLAKHLLPGGKAYVFEANPAVYDMLRKTLVLNNLENVVVLKNVAISDNNDYHEISDCTSITQYLDGTYSKAQKFSSRCVTLDAEMIDEKREIDLIAIDTHDMEIPILKACSKVIEKSPNIILVLTFDNDPAHPEARSELEYLKSQKMNFYIADKQCKLKEISLESILEQKNVVLVMTRKNLTRSS